MQPIHVSSNKQAKNQGFKLFIKAGKDAGFQSVNRNMQRRRIPSRVEKGSRVLSRVGTEFIKAGKDAGFRSVNRNMQRRRIPSRAEKGSRVLSRVGTEFIKAGKQAGF